MSFLLGTGFGPGSSGSGTYQIRNFNFSLTADGARNAHLVTPMKSGNSKKYTISAVFKHCDKSFNLVSSYSEINKNFFTTLRFESNKEPNKDTPNRVVFEQKEGNTSIFKVLADVHSGANDFISVVVQYDSDSINVNERVRIFINTLELEAVSTQVFPTAGRTSYFFGNNTNLSIFGAPGYEYFLTNNIDVLDSTMTGTIASVTVINNLLARPQDLIVFNTDSSGNTGAIKLKVLNSILDSKSIDIKFTPVLTPGNAFSENYLGTGTDNQVLPSATQYSIQVDSTRLFQFVTGRDRKYVSSDTLQTLAVEPAAVMFSNNNLMKNFEYVYPLNTYNTNAMQESYTKDELYKGYYPFTIEASTGGFGNKRVKIDTPLFNRNYGYYYTVAGGSINAAHGTELVVLNKHGGTTNVFQSLAHNLGSTPDAVMVFSDSRMIYTDAVSQKSCDCTFALNSENALSQIQNYNEGVTSNDLVNWTTTDSSTLYIKSSTRYPKIFDDSNVYIGPAAESTVTNLILDMGTFQLNLSSCNFNELSEKFMAHASKPANIKFIKIEKSVRTDAFIYDVISDTGTVKTVSAPAKAIQYNSATNTYTELTGTLRYDFNYVAPQSRLEQGVALLLKNTAGKLKVANIDTGVTNSDQFLVTTDFVPKFAILINRTQNKPQILFTDITIDGCRANVLKYGSELMQSDATYTSETLQIGAGMTGARLSDLSIGQRYSIVLFADSSTVRNALVDTNSNSVFTMVNMNGLSSMSTEVLGKNYVKFIHPKNYLKMNNLFSPFQNDTQKLFDIDEMGTLLLPAPNKASTINYMQVKTEKFQMDKVSDTDVNKYLEFRKIRDKINSDNIPDSNWIIEISTIYNTHNQAKYTHGKTKSIQFSQDCFESIDGGVFTNVSNQYISDNSVIGVEIYRKKVMIYADGILRYERNFSSVIPKDTKMSIKFQTSRGSTMPGSQFNLKQSEQELPKFKFNFGTEAFIFNRISNIDCSDVSDVTLINQNALFDQKLYTGNNTNNVIQLDVVPDLVIIREVTQMTNISPMVAWDSSDGFSKIVPMQYSQVNRVSNPTAATNFGRIVVDGKSVTVYSGAGEDMVNASGKMYIIMAFKQQDDFFKILKYNGTGTATQIVNTPHKSEYGFIFSDLSTGPKKLKNYFKQTSNQYLTVYESPINGYEDFTSEAFNTINDSAIIVKDQYNTIGETFTVYSFTSKSGHLVVDISDIQNNTASTPLNKSHAEQLSSDFKPLMIWVKPAQSNESFFTSTVIPGNNRTQLKFRIDNYSNQIVGINSNLKGQNSPQKLAGSVFLSQEGASFIVTQQTSENTLMYAMFGKPGYRRTTF